MGCLQKIIAATHFVGAKNNLHELHQLLEASETRTAIDGLCSVRNIEWHFILPRSPHFGGLWEAAVKSAKTHLKKLLHNKSYTFEQLATIVSEIEAVLNSRPLTAISDSPSDLRVLTPSHFLIGEPLNTLPDTEAHPDMQNITRRWTAIQALKSEFWRRWSREYLHELLSRVKWTKANSDIEPRTLAIIQDKDLPPLKWRMGRVTNVFPGEDGHCRVVELQTANGMVQRAITRIAPLPVCDEVIKVHEEPG